jgi:hypothetical protein
MKKCPFCAEESPEAAVVCRHCSRDLKSPASQAELVAPKKETRVFSWIVAGCFGLMFIGWLASHANATPTSASPAPSAAAVPAPPQLEILSSRGYKSSDSYFSVEGQVKNVSSEPLKHVAVVATWFDRNDTFIRTNSALIDHDPILPGQTSPFKTISRSNPEMSKFSLEFKRLAGGTIRTEDKTQH